MIEALIGYLQKKGFQVDVLPGYLILWKMIGGMRLAMRWEISPVDLALTDWITLSHAADRKILEFEVAEKAGPP